MKTNELKKQYKAMIENRTQVMVDGRKTIVVRIEGDKVIVQFRDDRSEKAYPYDSEYLNIIKSISDEDALSEEQKD